MKKCFFYVLLICFLSACSNNDNPDVSDIKVDATIHRFDTDFFSADTNNISGAMASLQKKYPYFFPDFVNFIVVDPNDTITKPEASFRQYLKNTRSLYNAFKVSEQQLQTAEKDIKKGFQYIQYYYPDYQLPKVVSYSGLIGDPPVALTQNAIAIGLQMYAGNNFAAYNTPDAQQVFPQYISRRFEPAYIAANCMQNLAEDIYPDQSRGKGLIEQMIEKGKQWHLLNKLAPHLADSVKTGYTKKQLDWCNKNEGNIWATFSKTTDVYSTDPLTLQAFIGESPKTEGFTDYSPGKLGQWMGLQIVKTYASKNKQLTLQQLLATDARKLFLEAKYKPK
jgi:hypothetical protein